jgi:hypothetical protein
MRLELQTLSGPTFESDRDRANTMSPRSGLAMALGIGPCQPQHDDLQDVLCLGLAFAGHASCLLYHYYRTNIHCWPIAAGSLEPIVIEHHCQLKPTSSDW